MVSPSNLLAMTKPKLHHCGTAVSMMRGTLTSFCGTLPTPWCGTLPAPLPRSGVGSGSGMDQLSLPKTFMILRFYVSVTLRLRTLQDDHATTSGTWCGAGFTVWVLLISGCPSLDHPPLDHLPRPRGFHNTTTEKPNHALWVVYGLEPPPHFHEKTPRERTNFGNFGGNMEKTRNCGPPL